MLQILMAKDPKCKIVHKGKANIIYCPYAADLSLLISHIA